MPAADTPATPSSKRVNELYWKGEASVDEIVKELEISRRALYTAVRPISAGRSCQECGARMVFTNRTRRDSGAASCLSCGAEFNASKRSDSERAGPPSRDPDHIGVPLPYKPAKSAWRMAVAGVSAERAAMICGAALLGVLVGATTARVLKDI